MAEYTLDARNMLCPLPVIRTQNRLRSLTKGDRLTVTCTDPGALHDIPAWCRIHGYPVIESHREGDEIIIRIGVSTVE